MHFQFSFAYKTDILNYFRYDLKLTACQIYLLSVQSLAKGVFFLFFCDEKRELKSLHHFRDIHRTRP